MLATIRHRIRYNGSSTNSASAFLFLAAGFSSGVLWASPSVSATTRLDSTDSSVGSKALLIVKDNATDKTQSNLDAEKPPSPAILFVWDFDWTVINCNSDEYIPAQFIEAPQLEEGFRDLYKSTGKDWHKCVEGMVHRAMDEQGATAAHILAAAAQMPYLTSVKQALDAIHENRRTQQMILSDGNTLFIQAFLERQGMVNHFAPFGIITNLGQWTDQGRLQVTHQSQQYGGHDCKACSANLCKTQALKKTLELHKIMHPLRKESDSPTTTNRLDVAIEEQPQQPRPRIVYVGDGANDACPVLHVLGPEDVMLARKGMKRICANGRQGPETDDEAQAKGGKEKGAFGILPALQKAKKQGIHPQCQILEWQTGEDLRQLVENILKDE